MKAITAEEKETGRRAIVTAEARDIARRACEAILRNVDAYAAKADAECLGAGKAAAFACMSDVADQFKGFAAETRAEGERLMAIMPCPEV
jgi:hypothetical protein